LDAPAGKTSESSIGDLFGRLAEDGKAFVRAEVGLYQAIAKRRAGMAAGGAAAMVAAFLLLNAALITLLVCLALGLAPHIGPVLAGLAVFAVTGLVAFLLVRYGMGKMQALSGDADEKAALAAGERAS
jgi:hypothetical protein